MLGSAGQSSLEFAYPWALLLIPALLVVWLWLRHWPHVVRVGSTFLWHRVAARHHHPRGPWSWLFISVLLATAVARPELVPTVPAPPLFRVVAAPGPNAVPHGELIVAEFPKPGRVRISIRADGRELIRDHLSADVGAEFGKRWRLPPSTFDARVLEATIATMGRSKTERVTLNARIPRRWTPTTVIDETGSEPVERALTALTATGWVERGTAEGALHFVRKTPSTGMRCIVIAAPGGAVLFPVPEPVAELGTLLDGLDPRQWTIERARTMDGATRQRFPDVVLDSDTGPLIASGDSGYWIAFDPSEASLASGAVWPILMGRMIENLATKQVRTPAPRWPARSPQWVILLLALVLLLVQPRTTLSTGSRTLIVLLVLGALAVPDLRAGSPKRRVVAPTASPSQILAHARSADILVVADSMGPILEESALVSALIERGIGLEVDRTVPHAMTLRPPQIEFGGRIELRVEEPYRSGYELTAVAPDGTRTPLTIPDTGLVHHEPSTTGHWYFQLLDSTGSVVASPSAKILESIEVLLISTGTGAGARALVRGRPFEVTEWRGDQPLATQLPERGGTRIGGIVLWDNVDPAALTEEDLDALSQWMTAGGVWMSAVAPPFHEPSPRKSQLSQFLPAPLPDPPRHDEVALGIILIDLSGSMSSGKSLDIISSATVTLLDSTPRGGRWGVATFRDQPSWIATPGSPVSREMIEATADLEAGGGTRLDRALDFVLSEFDSVAAGRTLVLLTDGRVNADRRWDRYRERLESAGVEVWVATIGDRSNDAALESLLPDTGGGLVHLTSAATAAKSLADAIKTPRGPWRSLRGDVRKLSLDPILSSVPMGLPSLRRWLPLQPHAESRSLLVSDEGIPILLERRVELGRAFIWASGFDASSLPGDYAGARVVSALSSILVAATRADAQIHRRAEVRESLRGNYWLTIERQGSAPSASGTIGGAGTRDPLPRELLARSRDHLSLPAPQPHLNPRWLQLLGESHGVEIDPHERARAVHRMAERVPAVRLGRWRTSSWLSLAALLTLVLVRLMTARRSGGESSHNIQGST